MSGGNEDHRALWLEEFVERKHPSVYLDDAAWAIKQLRHVLTEIPEEDLRLLWQPPIRPMVKLLAARDGWTCHYCQAALGWGHPSVTVPTLDHKVSKALGGDDSPENFVLACAPCNHAKGVTPHDDFCIRCP